jgi:hypothetical protein
MVGRFDQRTRKLAGENPRDFAGADIEPGIERELAVFADGPYKLSHIGGNPIRSVLVGD